MPEGIPWPFSRFYDSYINRTFVKWFRLIAADVKARHFSGTIVDIGTGPGRLLLEVAKQVDGVELVGIDISEDMVKIAKKNAEREGLADRVRYKVGSAYDTGLGGNSVDLILSTGMIHHLKNPGLAFDEFHRILRTGGEAWLYDGRRDATKAEFEATIRKLGMEGDLPVPLWLVESMWPHSHVGLKTAVYVSGNIGRALSAGLFKDYDVRKDGAYVTIMLRKT